MEYIFNKVNSKPDFQKMYEDTDNCVKARLYMEMFVLVFLLLTFLFSVGVMLYIKKDGLLINSLLVLFFVYLRAKRMFFRKSYLSKKSERAYNVSAKDYPESQYTLTEAGLKIKNPVEDQFCAAEDFYSIYFSQRGVYIFLGKSTPVFVFREDFDSEENWSAFYDFAKNNYCKTKRIYYCKKLSAKDYILSVLVGLLFSALFFAIIFKRVGLF